MSVTYSAAVPANPSQQLKAVLKMIEAGASFNMKEFSALTTDDYVHIWLPENVGLSKLSKDEFAGRIGMMGGLFTSFSVDIKEIIEAPGVMAIYMGVNAKTKGGNTNDPEVLNLVYVAQQSDGTYKVTKSREYVDTVKFARFGELVQKELAAAASE